MRSPSADGSGQSKNASPVHFGAENTSVADDGAIRTGAPDLGQHEDEILGPLRNKAGKA